MKRTILLLLIAASIGFILYVFFTFRRDQNIFSDPLAIVPSSVSTVMEFNIGSDWQDYNEWLRGLATERREVGGVPFNPVAAWHSALDPLDSLLQYDASWAAAMKGASVVMACPASGRGDQWAMIVGLDDHATEKTAEDLMTKLYKGTSFVKRSYEGTEIYESGEIRYAFFHKCLVVASAAVLMEDIVRCSTEQSVLSVPAFLEAKRSASADVPVHFYFSWKKNGWIGLDPQFSEERKLLSGYAVFSDSLFEENEQTKNIFSVAHVLPANVVLLDERSVSDFGKAWGTMDRKSLNTDEGLFWSRAWHDIGDSCKCDLNEALLSWRGGEWGAFVTEQTDSTTSEYLFFSVRDSMNAIALMQPVLADSSTQKIKQIIYPAVFDRNRYSSVLVSAGYATQIGTYVFISDDPEALLQLEASVGNGKFLSQTNGYKTAENVLNPKTGRLFFQKENVASFFPSALVNIFSGNFFAVNMLPFDVHKQMINVTIPDGDFKARIADEETPTAGGVIWECPLQASVRKGPWIVVNHNTNLSEVVVQDANNTLYLLGSDGQILWKRDLPGSLLSDVKQIDVLKNNKLQLVFNTSNAVYCIDRNGNDVGGFPVSLPKPATGALCVFDYDKNRSYRLLVACEDGQVYNFNIEGKRTEGWNYTPMGENVVALDHVRIGAEDYILVVGKGGKVELLKRNGQVRFSPKTRAEGFADRGFVILAASTIEESRMVYPDNTGKIIELTFGKGSRSDGLTGLSEGTQVFFYDINNDRKQDIVIAEGTALRMFDSSHERIAEVNVDGNIVFEPMVYRYSGGVLKIGVTTSTNKFYLLSTDGMVQPGFPRDAQSVAGIADFNRDKVLDVVVGFGTSVIVYK